MRCSPNYLFVSLFAAAVAAQTPSPKPAAVPTVQTAPEPTAVPPAQRPRAADQRELFQRFARMAGLEVAFTEQKQVALLAVPMESSGKLFFLPPAHLCRLVEKPSPSMVVITPDELRMQDKDKTEVVDLRRNDKLRAFITALVQVFAGDEAALQRSFTVDYALDPKLPRAWRLSLLPRGKPLDQMLQSMVLVGEGEAVQRIEWTEPNGDRTVTTVVSADPARRFDAAERQRWFGIVPK